MADAKVSIRGASGLSIDAGTRVVRDDMEVIGGDLRVTNDLQASPAGTGIASIAFSEDVTNENVNARINYNGDVGVGAANYLALACGDGAGGAYTDNDDGTLFVTTTGRVGVKEQAPVVDFHVSGQAIVRAGRGYTANRQVPVSYQTKGDAVFAIDPTLSNEQLAAFCGLTTTECSWEVGADAADAPAGAVIKILGKNITIGGHFPNCGFPIIPIEDALVTATGVPGRSQGDSSAIYYAEMWVKSDNATSKIYAGSTDYEHDITQVPHESATSNWANPGQYGYWMFDDGAGAATVPGTSAGIGVWTKLSGYITGFHDSNTGTFESDASYFSPMSLVNWGSETSDESSVMWISGWKIWKVSQRHKMVLQSTGDAALEILADTDNIGGENDNPLVTMSQDGGATLYTLGIAGDAGTFFTGAEGNAGYVHAGIFQIATAGVAAMTVGASQDIVMAGDLSCVALTQTSDARLKEDVTDLDMGVDYINSLRPVSYKRKDDDSDKRHLGLIAQEVGPVTPDSSIVHYNETTDEYSLGYTQLIAPLIKSVQELSARVKELETEGSD